MTTYSFLIEQPKNVGVYVWGMALLMILQCILDQQNTQPICLTSSLEEMFYFNFPKQYHSTKMTIFDKFFYNLWLC